MPNYILKKKDAGALIKALSKAAFCVYAPARDHEVDGGAIRFQKTKDGEGLCLDGNAYFPLKELFFRKGETILSFDKKGLKTPGAPAEKKAIFGIRRCDLHSLENQDRMFMREVSDPAYIAQREGTLLIGYHCQKAEDYCFCGSLSLKGKADLMLYDGAAFGQKGAFLVEVLSDSGAAVVTKAKKLFKPASKTITEKDRIIPGADRLDKKDIAPFYDNPKWEDGVKQCLSCSACNHHCPSCYCFSISDEVNVHDLSEGKRVRNWAGCQVKSFTKVAGGHIFREQRKDRFRHRIYHQLKYFKDRHGETLCSGCGRCIRHCPTRIDFVKILNEM